MNFSPRRLCLAALAALLAAAGARAEAVYVTVRSLKLRAGTGLARADRKAVAWPRYKEKLTVLGREDFWVRVQTADGKRGYVDEEEVSREQPKGDLVLEVGLSDVKGSVLPKGTIAARGLDRNVENAARPKPGRLSLDLEGLKRMMRPAQITPQELDRFMEEGGLGRRRGGR